MDIKNVMIIFKCNKCKKMIELRNNIIPLTEDNTCKNCGYKDFKVSTEYKNENIGNTYV